MEAITIEDLPLEILCMIYSHSDASSVVNMMCASRRLSEVCMSNMQLLSCVYRNVTSRPGFWDMILPRYPKSEALVYILCRLSLRDILPTCYDRDLKEDLYHRIYKLYQFLLRYIEEVQGRSAVQHIALEYSCEEIVTCINRRSLDTFKTLISYVNIEPVVEKYNNNRGSANLSYGISKMAYFINTLIKEGSFDIATHVLMEHHRDICEYGFRVLLSKAKEKSHLPLINLISSFQPTTEI